jgi:phage baseplate assembly protein W
MSGYRGISFPFRFNGRGGVSTSTTSFNNSDHIKESIQQILLTNIGERYMEYGIGSTISSYLFEVADDTTRAMIRSDIIDALTLHEPRITLNDVTVEIVERGDAIGFECTIDFTVDKFYTSDFVVVYVT